MLNLNGGLITCLSAYATPSNAFQLPALEPRRKYTAHISEAKCLGQTHREIKYTLCHLIWQLSFPSYWIEVVPVYICGLAVFGVFGCVSVQLCLCVRLVMLWFSFEIAWIHTQHLTWIIPPSRVKPKTAAPFPSLSVREKTTGFRLLYR